MPLGNLADKIRETVTTTPSIKTASTIQDTEVQEKEVIEISETQKIVVAPTIEIHQSAWTLACGDTNNYMNYYKKGGTNLWQDEGLVGQRSN